MTIVKQNSITDRFIEVICKRIAEHKRVRRSLPGWGRVHIDRQLPFLCIYRKRKDDENSLSERLVMGEASYLTATDNRIQQKRLALLVKSIAGTLKESFGSFLIVEVWVSGKEDQENEEPDYNGTFKIVRPKENAIQSAIELLEKSLKRIKIRKEKAEVEVNIAPKIAPQGLPPLLTLAEARQLGIHIIGIEVKPIYRNATTNEVYPIIRRKLEKGFSRSLKHCFFEFARNHTPLHPIHYQSLGRRSMVKAVWEVDRQLALISNSFDLLLQVTPVNHNTAWLAFKRSRFEKKPQFVYRPLTQDPVLVKRRLFKIPLERIEDPTLDQLFRQQQVELDRKLTMLSDRESAKFIYGSLQLYGPLDSSLTRAASELLDKFPSRSRDESTVNSMDAKTFAEKALRELKHFHKILPDSNSKVIIRDDITGLMVSKGNLLIGSRSKIPASRVEALIQHEVGTHVLTYLNGKAQPFQQLYIGLAGYDELQEGLAVLAEYLVGGLTRPRLRLLAARVIAANQMVNGASFVDVFRELNKAYGFERPTAFNIATRTFRGGGLTKDAIYLRGLIKILDYLKNGGELKPLYVGKISINHIAIIKELQLRKVLIATPLIPSYMDAPGTSEKIKKLQLGMTPINLI